MERLGMADASLVKQAQQLPPGWSAHLHEGQTYYCNAATGKSQWEPPSQWPPSVWVCQKCGLINTPDWSNCAACFEQRPTSVSASSSCTAVSFVPCLLRTCVSASVPTHLPTHVPAYMSIHMLAHMLAQMRAPMPTHTSTHTHTRLHTCTRMPPRMSVNMSTHMERPPCRA